MRSAFFVQTGQVFFVRLLGGARTQELDAFAQERADCLEPLLFARCVGLLRFAAGHVIIESMLLFASCQRRSPLRGLRG